MGDVVSWGAAIGVVGLVLTVIPIAYRLGNRVGKIEGKLDNGLTAAIAQTRQEMKDTRRDVKDGFDSVWRKLDELPCCAPHCPTEKPTRET